MRKALVILFLLLSAAVSATNYYVSYTDGNDSYTSIQAQNPATPWKTTAKINAQIFAAGDTIFFKCGDTWRITSSTERLNVDSGTSSGDVVYTSYGTGAKPLFLASKQENLESDWVNQGGNIWRNSDATFVAEVGNLIFNNEASYGWRVFTTPTATNANEFYYHMTSYYVDLYCTENPATYFTNIECGLKISGGNIYVSGSQDYVTIDGFDVRYNAVLGISMSSGAGNITIRNNDVSWIGGSKSSSDPASYTRLGNGIQLYGSGNDILIENNFIENMYDSGISPQYHEPTATIAVSNFVVRNNIISKCDLASFEFAWNVASGTVSGLYFQNNTCVNTGSGWSYNQRLNLTTTAGSHLRASSGSTVTFSNCYIRNNIFSTAVHYGMVYQQTWSVTEFTYDYNLYYVTTMASVVGTIYTTIAQWRTYSGDDAHSNSGNPNFTSATDFHLTESSTLAIDRGLGVGISYDYDWNLRDGFIDIGAYEYDGEVLPPPPTLATVTTTTPAVDLTTLTATGGGNVTWNGESAVTARGVCWGTTVNPTILNDTTVNGSGEGAFTSSITGLDEKTVYYVRAYAINGIGTSYGSNVSFSTAAYTELYYNGKKVYYNGKLVVQGGGTTTKALTDNLVAFWQMDEASGDAADATGNGHTGTATDIAYGETGQFDGAFGFNGTTSTLALAAISSGTTFTISAWVYRDESQTDNYGSILTNSNGSSGFYLMKTGYVSFYQVHNHESTSAVPNATWTHIAIVVNSGVGTFYIDGVAAGTVDHDLSNTSFTAIGSHGSLEEYKGLMDAIGFWVGRGLTAAEVASVMAATYPF